MRFSKRHWMKYGAVQQNADAWAAIWFWLPLTVLIGVILFLCAGCGTAALKPEDKLVSTVTSLPPVQVPLSVRCVKAAGGCAGADPAAKCQEMPSVPPATVDQNAPVLTRYYQMKADLLVLDEYKIKANAALLACAVEEPKP